MKHLLKQGQADINRCRQGQAGLHWSWSGLLEVTEEMALSAIPNSETLFTA
jgi:hypothetical protein